MARRTRDASPAGSRNRQRRGFSLRSCSPLRMVQPQPLSDGDSTVNSRSSSKNHQTPRKPPMQSTPLLRNSQQSTTPRRPLFSRLLQRTQSESNLKRMMMSVRAKEEAEAAFFQRAEEEATSAETLPPEVVVVAPTASCQSSTTTTTSTSSSSSTKEQSPQQPPQLPRQDSASLLRLLHPETHSHAQEHNDKDEEVQDETHQTAIQHYQWALQYAGMKSHRTSSHDARIDYERALDHVEEGLEHVVEDSSLYWKLVLTKAEVLGRQGSNRLAALQLYQLVLQRQQQQKGKDGSDSLAAQPNLYFACGRLAVGTGQTTLGLKYYEQELLAMQQDDENESNPLGAARVHLEMARVYRALGQHQAALESYQAALALEGTVLHQAVAHAQQCPSCHAAAAAAAVQQYCPLHVAILKEARAHVQDTKRHVGRILFEMGHCDQALQWTVGGRLTTVMRRDSA